MKKFILSTFILFGALAIGQNLKISELTSLTNAGLATNDVFPIVDTSAVTTKKFAVSEFDLRYAFTVSSPLSKTAGASPVVSIPLATSSVNGYLSSTDWSTFNNKVSLTGSETLTNKTLTAPIISTISNSGTLTLPTGANTLVGRSTTDTLTNKDYDGGTASNTSRITIPKAAKTTLDALTRKQGTIVYDTTSNKPYYDNGTILTVVGSGSGGGKNFVSDGDAEAGTTGWATFDDGAVTAPVNGTGGSPTIVTWSTTATAPLESLNSFTYVKTASDAQGEGVAYTFSLDPAYRAKVVNISFDYILSSGTFAAGTSSTNSDVTVWLYDVTNSALIQPSSFKLLSNSTTLADKFTGTFQTSATGASYRLILFSGSTSTSAYTLKVDNVSVAPSNYTYGTPITDWQAATFTGAWVSNTTYTAKKRRIGDSYEYDVQLALTGAPTSATLTLTLPSGDVIDTPKLASGTNTGFNSSLPGRTNIIRGSAYTGGINYASTTTVTLTYFDTNGNGGNVTQAAPATFANGDYVGAVFRVPIVGLSSSVQMSDQTSTRVVSFSGEKSGGSQAVTGLTTDITFASVKDTHGGWSGSAYTVTVPGDYIVSTSVYSAASVANTFIFKNGAAFTGVNNSPANTLTAGSALVPNLIAGDTISLRTAASITIAGDAGIKFGISRVAGPNQIAASEKISFSYQGNSGQTLNAGSSVLIKYPTKISDSHNIYDTATGNWTMPRAARCHVTAHALSGTFDPGAASYAVMSVYKNGVEYKVFALTPADAGSTTYGFPLSASYDSIAGDVFDVRLVQGLGNTTINSGAASYNFVDLDCN